MMIEQAVVIGYQNGIAQVQCYAKAGCGGCSAQGACGTKSLSALAGEKRAAQFSLAVNQPLQIGDTIEIGLAEHHLLQGVIWLYAVPLAVMLCSTLLLSQWVANEIILALGILICTLSAFLGIKQRLARQQTAQLMPIFLRKI
ncbi:sigma-E factor regulatory protein [[Actinobacillus] muris]|uniref:Sigma-E factor regulatory protein n=1 Tax=Muribacter muris TaxID=67855 RepID=A0A0J5S3H6_9PAST|nr:SoxR reducing system RseC family protein [Muribacter muris]KMK51347.1 sigma-E factor regulatory protein [[Actinobacillus] muris] [Muribacter muris]